MHFLRTILVSLFLLEAALAAGGAETELRAAPEKAVEAAQAPAAPEEHGLPPKAVEIGRIGAFPITNSMLVSWLVALGLIVFAQLATRKMKEIPDGAQNFLEGIIGPQLVRRTFWFFATIFIFILFSNWIGLIPGVGTIGWGVHDEHGFRVSEPLLREANADLNMTFAMALIFFACWTVWAIQANGPIGFLLHLFAPQGDSTGLLKLLMIVVFIAVGFLEVFSILFRPISLSFRLYGNIFAGGLMLETMGRLVPGWIGSIILPIPFYFMEVLVGFVQALVFMLLTAVFTMLICPHEEGHEKGSH